MSWEFLDDGMMPLEILIDQFPSKFDREGNFYSVSYRPICDGE